MNLIELKPSKPIRIPAPDGMNKLKTALKLKNQEIEVLHQISQAVSGNLNLEEVLRHIIELVTEVTRGDACLL